MQSTIRIISSLVVHFPLLPVGGNTINFLYIEKLVLFIAFNIISKGESERGLTTARRPSLGPEWERVRGPSSLSVLVMSHGECSAQGVVNKEKGCHPVLSSQQREE